MYDWFLENSVYIFGSLFFLSEALGVWPSIKANGVFQAVYNLLKKAAGK